MAFADDSVIESLDPEPGSVEEFYLLVGTLINVSKPNGKASFHFRKKPPPCSAVFIHGQVVEVVHHK